MTLYKLTVYEMRSTKYTLRNTLYAKKWHSTSDICCLRQTNFVAYNKRSMSNQWHPTWDLSCCIRQIMTITLRRFSTFYKMWPTKCDLREKFNCSLQNTPYVHSTKNALRRIYFPSTTNANVLYVVCRHSTTKRSTKCTLRSYGLQTKNPLLMRHGELCKYIITNISNSVPSS